MASKKQATKKQEPRIQRLGRWVGRNGPAAAKKLGRASKRTATATAAHAKSFAESFLEGFREA